MANLSAAVKLPIKKRFLGNPTLGTNLGSRILAMRTGCTGAGLRRPRHPLSMKEFLGWLLMNMIMITIVTITIHIVIMTTTIIIIIIIIAWVALLV